MLPCRNLYAVPDTVLLHRRFTLRRRGIAVPRNSLTCYTAQHLRIRRLILFIFAGAVYYNALTNCATRSCCACVDLITCVAERYLTLRTGCERHGRKNPLPFPLFRSGHMSAICARLSRRERGRFTRRRKPQVASSLCPRRVGGPRWPQRNHLKTRNRIYKEKTL